MFKLIAICILLCTLFISSSIAGGLCSAKYQYPFQCVEEGMECNENKTCGYGYGCLPNQYIGSGSSGSGLPSMMADVGASFEPYPTSTCQRLGSVGDSCQDNKNCLPYLRCTSYTRTNSTCQVVQYAQVGDDCSTNYQCYNYLVCDPFSKTCIPDLSLNDNYNGYQCTEQTHCSYGYQCDTNNHRCVPKVALGQQCGGNVENGICIEDTICSTYDIDSGNSSCITPFSIPEGGNCSSNSQVLNGGSGIYISPCVVGLICTNSVCTKPTWSSPSVNCNDGNSTCEQYESCLCNNGTSTENVVAQCVPNFITDNSVQSECAQLTTELMSCAKDHKCSDYGLYLIGETWSSLLPGSCIQNHCSSTICEIQGKCIPVTPNAAPTCGDYPSYSDLGVCGDQFNSANSLSTSIAIVISVIVSVLLF